MRLIFILAVIYSSILSIISCKNEPQNLYNESNYFEKSQGLYKNYHTITYQNKFDSNYLIRKVYSDSLYDDNGFAVFKYFFYKDVMNGPSEFYRYGRLISKGFMKSNRRHGEFLYYGDNSKIDKREFYDEGKPAGVWEDYYSTGILFKKVYYDYSGKFVKQEIYDTKHGKLIRTEYIQSREY